MNLILCQRYGFFSVLAAIIRENSDKQLVLRIVKALPFIHQPDRVALCKQLIGYINTREKNDIFSRVLLQLFSGPEILVEHRSLYDKNSYQ